VEEFRSASNLREDEEHEPSEAAMAELAANQQVHYIVAAEKVMHPSISPSRPRLLDFSQAFNARSSRRRGIRSTRC